MLFLLFFISSCKKSFDKAAPISVAKEGDGLVHRFVMNGKEIIVEERDGVFYFEKDITLSPDQMNMLRTWDNSGTHARGGSA